MRSGLMAAIRRARSPQLPSGPHSLVIPISGEDLLPRVSVGVEIALRCRDRSRDLLFMAPRKY